MGAKRPRPNVKLEQYGGLTMEKLAAGMDTDEPERESWWWYVGAFVILLAVGLIAGSVAVALWEWVMQTDLTVFP